MSDENRKRKILAIVKEHSWVSARDLENLLRLNRKEAMSFLSEMVKDDLLWCETDEATGVNYFRLPPDDYLPAAQDAEPEIETIEQPKKENPMSSVNEMRTTNDIRRFLAQQMEAVASGKQTPDQAKAICAYAQQMYNITKLEIDYAKVADKLAANLPKVQSIEFNDGGA